MAVKSDFRRYLVDIDSISASQLFTDCLIVGAGIAGLRAALEAAESRNVIVVCKETFEDSNTNKAQGGIASVLDKADKFESHIADTLKTGCGISNRQIVDLVVRRGPQLVRQLLEWGTEFDLEKGKIATTLEGGHSFPRVAHAHGDETGRMISEALIRKVRQNKNIRILEHFFTVDLLTDDEDNCLGIIGHEGRDPRKAPQMIWAPNTVLATGGLGRLYRETTNPPVSTGDGIAMAYRAGAILQDMEFLQFHPTTLYIAGASRALITEALRGEGAILLDCNDKRFMPEYDEAAELAPRDIVSRAILAQMRKTESTHVYLDVRHFDKAHFANRFPLISDLLESFDIDITHDLIPVRPSAHYMIGGVKTDLQGKTNLANLFACGEVASTGLHGANRLGSNSLLEGLVFGKIVGKQLAESSESAVAIQRPHLKYRVPHSDRTRLDASDVRNSLRALMWRNVGITRIDKALAEAQEIINFWRRYVMDKVFDCPRGWECQNMLSVSLLMARAALMRTESRGVHFRRDYPETNDRDFVKHIELTRES